MTFRGGQTHSEEGSNRQLVDPLKQTYVSQEPASGQRFGDTHHLVDLFE